MGPPPRSLASDAHDCIMVRTLVVHRIQGCGRRGATPGRLPSFVWHALRLARPPPPDHWSSIGGGRLDRALEHDREAQMQKKKIDLDRKGPIQGRPSECEAG